ncbi:MAG: 2-C-methyl-D-erythritol 4-phosphate cytidylyltransferase [Pseudomonadota bacterium]|nr:2-C-methyl-D-erythritol 4-phosphate cytidylyltransferase [Pseudomonadota bacterium]
MSVIRYWAVVPAAGAGRRMGSAIPKQYLLLAGQPVIAHTLDILLRHPRLSGVVVAISVEDEWWPEVVAARVTNKPLLVVTGGAARVTNKPLLVVTGGAERGHSVLNGLDALWERAQPDDWVLVHDAARPCLSVDDLDRLLTELAEDAVGGLLAVPVSDTLKQADRAGRVAATVDRSQLWRALTPQMFRLGLLREALREALARGQIVTDEAAAMEAAGFTPQLIEGRADNLKITRPEDLALAEFYLTRGRSSTMRIGHGFDVHAFGPGEWVTLGGVRIPHTHGLIAHSDGDVLLHALCDALLGAAGLGDIGQHFPDNRAEFRNIDSRILLRQVVLLLREQRLAVGNVDTTIVAQAPRMASYISAMRENIAVDLQVSPGQVNVKATTTERLGYIGRGEGIAVHAVAMLV